MEKRPQRVADDLGPLCAGGTHQMLDLLGGELMAMFKFRHFMIPHRMATRWKKYVDRTGRDKR
jgi:hypothetical protein